MITVAQNQWLELITVQQGTETLECVCGSEATATERLYLKLQRELFARANFTSLTIQEMLWKLGLNPDEYYAFIYTGTSLDNAPMNYDVVAYYYNGPTVVAVKRTTHTSETAVLNAINRGGILKNRIV